MNFVGAEQELRRAIEQWSQVQICDVMLPRGNQWKFNPPAGSRHGGVWEWLMRSVNLNEETLVIRVTWLDFVGPELNLASVTVDL